MLGAGYLVWFRDSSLVAVERVEVTGVEGPEAQAAERALTRAARGMTTLHVREDELRAAVAGLPTVAAVEARPDFPHALLIEVSERPPVMLATAGSERVPVAGDGTLLGGVEAGGLAEVKVEDLPASGRLTGEDLDLARVAGAAPAELLPLVRDVAWGEAGIAVELEGGFELLFGGADSAEEKWAAAAAVLADPRIDTLTHVDVRIPERPAVGGAAPPAEAEGGP